MNDNDNLRDLLEKLRELEANAARLYRLFADRLPEDRGFWLDMSEEENHHAWVIARFGEELLTAASPAVLATCTIETLQALNTNLEEMIERYAQQVLTRRDACLVAIQLERAAGELHFDCALNAHNSGISAPTLDHLASQDNGHVVRLRRHLIRVGNQT